MEGVTIEENGRKYSLVDRMANEYSLFADMVDQDIDFKDLFIADLFKESINDLFKKEARTLASNIAG